MMCDINKFNLYKITHGSKAIYIYTPHDITHNDITTDDITHNDIITDDITHNDALTTDDITHNDITHNPEALKLVKSW